MPTCYMCDDPGITREHVPPRCFHPEGYREGMIVVPSCEKHNLANSKDVEAVRNVVALWYENNEVGLSLAHGAVLRSLQRSPGLAVQTLADMRRVVVNGKLAPVFRCEVGRVQQLMKSIAFGMYYYTFKQRYVHEWEAFLPDLVSEKSLGDSISDGWDTVRKVLGELSYSNVETPSLLSFNADFGLGIVITSQFFGSFFTVVSPCTRSLKSEDHTFQVQEAYSGGQDALLLVVRR